MRGFMIACVIGLACMAAVNTATAADVSDQTLSAMGLADMAPMSDAAGMEVRGKGLAVAWGSGTAGFSRANYFALSEKDNALALGGGAALSIAYSAMFAAIPRAVFGIKLLAPCGVCPSSVS